MTAAEIRQSFLDFFEQKGHKVVPSAPIVVKDDPSLMFVNAGMNQFKDIFLGNKNSKHKRVADTQKCLRVSGKHNDLEEVGLDTYHHTMFEMLGNWSFGDYFKKEAIQWAWELLTKEYKIDADRLYVTYFGGDKSEGTPADKEAAEEWKKHVKEDHIMAFGKAHNFWEMGSTGPCGPCCEIHVDLRNKKERAKKDGKDLVNAGHPGLVELWNLVFIQYNRTTDGSLEDLPERHVDTGMGFERLCMVLQDKSSNYDTDLFSPLLKAIEELAPSFSYGKDDQVDIAMRVICDHLRAVAFSIADGQIPSNTGPGYVIRRILRRGIRYGYSFLNWKEAMLYKLVPVLVKEMSSRFPELEKQARLIQNVLLEEEESFLRTLEKGIKLINDYKPADDKKPTLDGAFAFELYDTFGFPLDLSQLLAREKGWEVDESGFEAEMQKQRSRSRDAAASEAGEWQVLGKTKEIKFLGYDQLSAKARLIRYRELKSKEGTSYQLVLDQTPFYAESGGQVGDTGTFDFDGEIIAITDTRKENELIIHYCEKLPNKLEARVLAQVNEADRLLIVNNHSATHLLHAALKEVLGDHVEQKGSLVNAAHLRFDFSHFSKMSNEDIAGVEKLVNRKIRENLDREVQEDVPLQKAIDMGASALFGEKYGETVRVIIFDKDFSIELCGGTHVPATGQIGFFKIVSESAIAAGVRRIEAITAEAAENYISNSLDLLHQISAALKQPVDKTLSGVTQLIEENRSLKKRVEKLDSQKSSGIKDDISKKVEPIGKVNFIGEEVELSDAAIKQLAFDLKNEVENLFLIIGGNHSGKVNLTIMVGNELKDEDSLHAGNLIKELAKEIRGGGGGQQFYATAGGKDAAGIERAIQKAREIVKAL